MNERDMDQKIAQAFGQIEPPETDLMPGIRKKLDGRPRRRRRALVIAIVLAVVVAVTAAAAITSYIRLVREIGPEYGEQIAPVQMVSESEDIRVELIAAGTDGDRLDMYLYIEDLAGDRISENTTPWMEIQGTGSVTTNRVSADDGGFTLSVSAERDEILAEPVTLEISHFSTGVSETVNLSDLLLTEADAGQTVEADGSVLRRTGPNGQETVQSVLLPGDLDIDLLDRGDYHLYNAGIVDGVLQVLVAYHDDTRSSYYESCWFYLEDANGNRIESSGRLNYGMDEGGEVVRFGEDGVEYSVYLFPPEEIDLNHYSLFCHYYYSVDIYGDWHFTFLPEPTETIQADCHIQAGEMEITGIQVSPFGVTLSGKDLNQVGEDKNPDIVVTTASGDVVVKHSGSGINHEAETTKKYFWSDTPLSLDDVLSITLYGETVYFST